MTTLQLPLHWGSPELPATPKSVLVVQISAMGDQIQTLPAVSDIAARWPGITIDWAVDGRFADIPRLHPAVRHVIALPLKALQQRRSATEFRALCSQVRALRAQRYDLIWDPHSVFKSAMISRLARGKLRVGYRAQDCGGEPLAARAYNLHFARPPGIHGTTGRRVFAQAVLDTDPTRPVAYAIRNAWPAPDQDAAPYALLAHGASKSEKLWPQSSWRALGSQLVELGLKLVLPWGSEAERIRAEELVAAWPAGVARLADRGGLTEMARLIAGAALVVGLDTGFSHFAAALQRPLVVLFTDTGPELFTPEIGAISRTLGGHGNIPDVHAAVHAAQQVLAAWAALQAPMSTSTELQRPNA